MADTDVLILKRIKAEIEGNLRLPDLYQLRRDSVRVPGVRELYVLNHFCLLYRYNLRYVELVSFVYARWFWPLLRRSYFVFPDGFSVTDDWLIA